MSNEQYAFLTRSELPTLEQLQAKINSDPTFTLAIDPEVSLSTTAGFVPCVICGVESGVEIYFDDSPETMDQFADLVQGKDCCLVFCWRSDMVECACAMVPHTFWASTIMQLLVTMANHQAASKVYAMRP